MVLLRLEKVEKVILVRKLFVWLGLEVVLGIMGSQDLIGAGFINPAPGYGLHGARPK